MNVTEQLPNEKMIVDGKMLAATIKDLERRVRKDYRFSCDMLSESICKLEKKFEKESEITNKTAVMLTENVARFDNLDFALRLMEKRIDELEYDRKLILKAALAKIG